MAADEAMFIEAIILLKKYNADGTIEDNQRRSAIARAKGLGWNGVVAVLEAPTCSAGSELTIAGCSTCPSGSVSAGGLDTCQPCPDGSITDGVSCESCAAPAAPNADKTECVSPPDYSGIIAGAAVGGILLVVILLFLCRRKVGGFCVQTGYSSGMMCCVKMGNCFGAQQQAADPDALVSAVRSGKHSMVKHVLDGGADPNGSDSSGTPALIAAVMDGGEEKVQIVEALIAKGANINQTLNGQDVVSLCVQHLSHVESTPLIETFLKNGFDMNAKVKGEPLLLAVLKTANCKLADIMIQKGCRVDITDASQNTPLHIAAAIADEVVVQSLLDRGASAKAKNADDQTPVVSARFATIATSQRLSANFTFCQKTTLTKNQKCNVTSRVMVAGEEAFVCPVTSWCCSTDARFSPAFPRNHEVAAKLALQCGDVYNLTDAVEGAWLAELTPPAKAQNEVKKVIMDAIMKLVSVLQGELRDALKKQDIGKLEQGIEMVRYAQVAQMPEEQQAVKMLCKLKLEEAMAARSSIQLGQALMTASQYDQTGTDTYKKAQNMEQEIREEERITGLKTQLADATKSGNLMLLQAAMEAAEKASLKDASEYKKAQSELQKVVSNALQAATKSGQLQRIHHEMTQAKQFKLQHLDAYQSADEGLTQAIKAAIAKAIKDMDNDALKGAIQDAEKYGRADLSEVGGAKSELKDMPRKQCDKMLREAVKSGDGAQMAMAIQFAVQKPEVQQFKMRETDNFKNCVNAYRKAKAIPENWDISAVADSAVEGKLPLQITSANRMVNAFQMLFDQTNRVVRTRDRRGAVPKRLEVKDVEHVQNGKNYIDYMRRRENIRKVCQSKGTMRVDNINDGSVCKTFAKFPNGKQFHGIWQELEGMSETPIDTSINEFYLFHGTKPEAAKAIAQSDFRVDLAGSNAGTLYGRGIYFGESCSKSDEYGAEADSSYGDRTGCSPMLVCRVTCGRLNYQDAVYPDTDAIVKSCTSGEYHCCLGDREKCRGTFREFIVYDNDQAYPEFIVWYKRIFD
eukprot:gnl/MRDRNA2_/MRDRNA2_72600_c0_seq1.p1 gnl/MRDRNA2_/MRDRNA2_72600_c0~~gnl/MRDRNA2_/MRDRNA2_72600_c0_seq1.p1  ORF type:complete len:1125 (+),score=239.69 gnl/MRDRNA2_/MRDRNA2_72600_c0_seq1:297-3377(+)